MAKNILTTPTVIGQETLGGAMRSTAPKWRRANFPCPKCKSDFARTHPRRLPGGQRRRICQECNFSFLTTTKDGVEVFESEWRPGDQGNPKPKQISLVLE